MAPDRFSTAVVPNALCYGLVSRLVVPSRTVVWLLKDTVCYVGVVPPVVLIVVVVLPWAVPPAAFNRWVRVRGRIIPTPELLVTDYRLLTYTGSLTEFRSRNRVRWVRRSM